MIIAQLTDTHLQSNGKPLGGGIDSVAALEACVRHINALPAPADLVLATGDMVNHPSPEDYAALRRILDGLDMPYYVIPGNHDHRDMMRHAFADKGYLSDGPFLHYTIEDHPLRMVGLDTTIAGEMGGEMCAERRQWLAERLDEQPDRPTLIFMHHPPFATGIGFMDKPPFGGAAELERIVAGHPAIERVICGHSHRQVQRTWGGTTASVSPSGVFQMILDLTEAAPSAFVLEPAGIPLYMWDAEAGLIAHMSLVGDFGPPHPFTMSTDKTS